MTSTSNKNHAKKKLCVNKKGAAPKPSEPEKPKINFGTLGEALPHSGSTTGGNRDCRYFTDYNGIKDKFTRVHPGSAIAANVLLHTRDDAYKKDIYFITNQDVANELSLCDCKVKQGWLFIYQDQHQKYGVDFLSNSSDSWTESKRKAVETAQSGWTKMTNVDNGKDGFSSREAPGIKAIPDWPDDLESLFLDIMDGHIIEDMDHPIVKQYQQATFGYESIDTGADESRTEHIDDIDDIDRLLSNDD